MVTVEKANREMIDNVYKLLQDFKISRFIKRDDWGNIFMYDWDNDENYYGYVLVDKCKIAGFLGAIFSKRVINGKTERFCNLTAWMVKESYRNKSISLFFPILKLENYTITNLTASDDVYIISKKLGFRDLDSKITLLFLSPYLGKSCFSITTDKSVIAKQLRDNDLKIFYDHLPYKCGHLLVYNTNSYCYMVYTRRRFKKIPLNHIHFISDKEIFIKNINQIKMKLFKENKSLLTMVDARLLGSIKVPFSINYKLFPPRLYKSSRLKLIICTQNSYSSTYKCLDYSKIL